MRRKLRMFLVPHAECVLSLAGFRPRRLGGNLAHHRCGLERNQPAMISLIQGNHSNEHKSYRIAGKWDAKNTVLSVIDPRSKSIALTDSLIDMGEDAEAMSQRAKRISSRAVCAEG